MRTTYLLIMFCLCASVISGETCAQGVKPADVTFNDDGTIYFVRGKSKEFKVSGKNLSVQSIKVTPAGGVTLRETKEFVFDPKSHISMRKGYRMLTLTIDVAADAEPGDRTLVVVTPEASSKPHPISIRDHVPVITNLKAAVISRDKKEVRIDFEFTDAAGDINSNAPPQVGVICNALFLGQAFGSANIEALNMKDDGNGSITATARFTGFRPNLCALFVTLRDKNGNASDDATVTVDFNK